VRLTSVEAVVPRESLDQRHLQRLLRQQLQNQPIVVSSIRGASDRNIIMQLRKAQDVGGNHEIEFRRGKGKLDKGHIDTLLKVHDNLTKPQDKRRMRIAITQHPDSATKLAKSLQSKGH
jgi:hypothetical protein